MKKRYILLVLGLICLTACSVKKTTSTNKDSAKKLDNSISGKPLWNKTEEELDQLVTKKIAFPEREGVVQTQVITYQGKEWLTLTMEQIQSANDEIKSAITEVGIEETQKALEESINSDEKYQQAKNLPGFSYQVEITPDQKLKITTTYDLKLFNLDEMDKLEYFRGFNLRNILELTPSQYIENRLQHGARIEE